MAGRKPRPSLTEDEIMSLEGEKLNNKLHKGRMVGLTPLSDQIQNDLSSEEEIISLDELGPVKEKTMQYFKACEKAGTLPSVLGLSRSLGHSRQSLYLFLDRKPHSQVAHFLQIVRDAISEMLDAAALSNSVNSIVAIFIQKSIHQRIDRSEVFLKTQQLHAPDDPVLSHDEIVQKYLPEDDI